MQQLDEDKLRDLPGWPKNAPVPICMGGDYRALTFCCKPGYSLTYGFKCQRDKVLAELGITPEEFVEIKEKFSKENDWDTDTVCFGSISYCCMRASGCPRRDPVLMVRYPGLSLKEFMTEYFKKKKELAKIILEHIKDPEAKKKAEYLLTLF
ncbi:MAG: methanogenesis marker 9 domain-containing protein [Promethearchaeota archaeon]